MHHPHTLQCTHSKTKKTRGIDFDAQSHASSKEGDGVHKSGGKRRGVRPAGLTAGNVACTSEEARMRDLYTHMGLHVQNPGGPSLEERTSVACNVVAVHRAVDAEFESAYDRADEHMAELCAKEEGGLVCIVDHMHNPPMLIHNSHPSGAKEKEAEAKAKKAKKKKTKKKKNKGAKEEKQRGEEKEDTEEKKAAPSKGG
jgi:hypothetical protein